MTSMLHHHFMYHGLGEKDVKLHMDNCSGQNKNTTVIGYILRNVLPNHVVERMVKVNGFLDKNYFYEKVWIVEGNDWSS